MGRGNDLRIAKEIHFPRSLSLLFGIHLLHGLQGQFRRVQAEIVERRRRQMTTAENALFGIEKLNVPLSEIPAATHIDYSARIQTVHKDTNALYHALIAAWENDALGPAWGRQRLHFSAFSMFHSTMAPGTPMTPFSFGLCAMGANHCPMGT